MPAHSPSLVIAAIICGAFIPVHAGMNASLSRTAANPIWATILSFGVSFGCLMIATALLRPGLPTWSSLASTPVWAWLGGAIGVAYVIANMMLTPRLGTAAFIAAVIAGQMTMALAVDHFGLLGFPRRPVELSRIIGTILVIGGVLAMQLNRNT